MDIEHIRCKTVHEAIGQAEIEGKKIDPAIFSVCPHWWNSSTQEIANGMIDTYICKRHVCTDVILIRPYSIKQLKSALEKRCKGARSDLEYFGECERGDTNVY